MRCDELKFFITKLDSETEAEAATSDKYCDISITLGCFLSYQLTWTTDSAPSLPPTRFRRRTEHVAAPEFISESPPTSLIGYMATSLNVNLSAETIESIAVETLSMASQAMASNPNSRVLAFGVSVEIVKYVESLSELERIVRRFGREDKKIVPANKLAIDSLEYVVREKLERCSVCLEDYDDQDCDHQMDQAVRMRCSHVFHKDCIVQWLNINHYCPLCRYALPTD